MIIDTQSDGGSEIIGSENGENSSNRMSPNQQALRELAQESVNKAKKGNPISEEAKILNEWAR